MALGDVPIYDVHTHLVGDRLTAHGLHDVLLYHMAVSDLYAAGCPEGERLTQFPGFPDEAEATARIEQALPFLHRTRNTSNSWMVRTILSDLYDWTEPVTADNWQRLNSTVVERSAQPGWADDLFDRGGIARTNAEYGRRGDGSGDDRLASPWSGVSSRVCSGGVRYPALRDGEMLVDAGGGTADDDRRRRTAGTSAHHPLGRRRSRSGGSTLIRFRRW